MISKANALRLAALLAMSAFLLLGTSQKAASQMNPDKSIRFIVPYAAGGPTDVIGRIIAQKLGEGLRRTVVVDNRVGANGIIGTEMLAKAKPDGSTLGMVAISLAINVSLYKKLPYDALKDFSPVTLATSGPMLLAIHPSIPVNDLKGLLEFARAKPNELTAASAGNGSIAHLALELLNHTAGIKIRHVPYKGASQALADVRGGHVSMYFGTVIGLLPSVNSGKLRGLAVSTTERFATSPDVPTLAEAGVPGYEVSSWLGVMAPAKTPTEVISRFNAEIVKQLKTPDMQKTLASNGAQAVGSTPEQFHDKIAKEIIKWEKVVKAAGVKAD